MQRHGKALGIGLAALMPLLAGCGVGEHTVGESELNATGNAIYALAALPDGRTLVVGGETSRHVSDGEVDEFGNEVTEPQYALEGFASFWETATGRNTGLLNHHRVVTALAAAPDGQSVAIGTFDKHVRVFDLKTQKNRWMKDHDNQVNGLAYSHDGRLLASAGWKDNTFRLWDAATGAVLKVLPAPEGNATSVSFSPDGKWLAGGSGNVIRIYEVASGTLKQTLRRHTGTVNSVAFSPDGKTLASGSADRTILLWSVPAFTVQRTLTGHADTVYSVAFSPDSASVLSGSKDATAELWEAATGTPRYYVTPTTYPINAVVFLAGGTGFAAGSGDGKTYLFDTRTGRLNRTIE